MFPTDGMIETMVSVVRSASLTTSPSRTAEYRWASAGTANIQASARRHNSRMAIICIGEPEPRR
jgi:hypothetical protein